MTIQFQCSECNAEISVSEELAGERERCPSCKSIQTVPATEEKSNPTVHKTEEEAYDAYQARKKRERSERPRAVPWRAIVILLLILGIAGGVTAYFLMQKSDLANDLKLVPHTSETFVSIRVADVWETEWYKKIRKGVLPDYAYLVEPIRSLETRLGIKPEQIERLTSIGKATNHFLKPEKSPLHIVRTKSPYDQQTILARMPESKSVSHQGKNYHTKGSNAVWFVNENVFVYGDEFNVRQSIEADLSKNPLSHALLVAGGDRHVTLGMTNQAIRNQVKRHHANPQIDKKVNEMLALFGLMGPGPFFNSQFDHFDSLAFSLTFDSEVKLNITWDFRQVQDARALQLRVLEVRDKTKKVEPKMAPEVKRKDKVVTVSVLLSKDVAERVLKLAMDEKAPTGKLGFLAALFSKGKLQ